jgi:hypothetical protein
MIQTVFTTTETIVKAAMKMASIAPTMVCKVLSIVFVIVEESFANPKLAFFELQPALIIINLGNSPSDPTDQPQLHRICAPKFLSSFFCWI